MHIAAKTKIRAISWKDTGKKETIPICKKTPSKAPNVPGIIGDKPNPKALPIIL